MVMPGNVTLLWADYMHNTLTLIVNFEFRDIEILAIVIQRLNLQPGYRVNNTGDTAFALV